MDSINEHRVRQRLSLLTDISHGVNADGKAFKEHVKNLQKSVGIEKESMGTAKDFLRDVGSI